MLGIIRITGQSAPAICRMAAMLSPAAMVTSTKRSLRSRRTGPSSESRPAIIWGLTPKKIRSHCRATCPLSAAAPPSSAARARAFSWA